MGSASTSGFAYSADPINNGHFLTLHKNNILKFVRYKLLVYFIFQMITVTTVLGQGPSWPKPESQTYKYTATIVAEIQLSEIPSYSLEDTIALFVNGEIRGLSRSVAIGNGKVLHFITVYSNKGVDTMSLNVYHRNTDLVYDVATPFEFRAQGIYGNLTSPMIVHIYPDNDAPLKINNVSPQTTMQSVPFQPIDMSEYLVQPDSNEVSWMIVNNPNLNAYFVGSILYVQGTSGFLGQTNLIVMASEISSRAYEESRGESSRNVAQAQVAETSIQFTVTPLLLAPLWQPKIPSQSIVVGDQFQLTELSNFENQYNGPFIKYSYRPIILGSETPQPQPDWNLDVRYGFTMTVAARVDYTPKYQFHHADDVLAAFVKDTIRGVAKLDSITGLYFLSVGGFAREGDTVIFKFYSGEMQQVLIHKVPLIYKPYAIHGNLISPYIIDLAPIAPIVPDLPVVGGIYNMPIEIRDSSFLGSIDFEFIAEDPNYPALLHDESIATFCIVQDSSQLFNLYLDADGDGFGDPEISTVACKSTVGYVDNGDDCDDTNPEDPFTTIEIHEDSGWQYNDGYVCSGVKVELVASGAQSYVWQDGSTNPDIIVIPEVTTTYRVTVTHASGCKGVKTVVIYVEGKVVTNSANDGFGTLRNVLGCLMDGDTLTFDQPNVNFSYNTAPLEISKNAMISGVPSMIPSIFFDHTLSNGSFIFFNNKTLILNHVDINIANPNTKNVFEGQGKVDITGVTRIK